MANIFRSKKLSYLLENDAKKPFIFLRNVYFLQLADAVSALSYPRNGQIKGLRMG